MWLFVNVSHEVIFHFLFAYSLAFVALRYHSFAANLEFRNWYQLPCWLVWCLLFIRAFFRFCFIQLKNESFDLVLCYLVEAPPRGKRDSDLFVDILRFLDHSSNTIIQGSDALLRDCDIHDFDFVPTSMQLSEVRYGQTE